MKVCGMKSALFFRSPMHFVRRRWRAAEAVDVAESRIRHKALVGVVTHQRAGLGSSTTSRNNKAQGKDR
ncbi:hypothetical protein SRHO_G00291650 [Serrasalmus rhombeus]